MANWNSKEMCGKKLVSTATWIPSQKAPDRLSHSRWASVTTEEATPQLSSSHTCTQPCREQLRKALDALCEQGRSIPMCLENKNKIQTLGLHHPRLNLWKYLEELKNISKIFAYLCSLWSRASLMLQCIWPAMKVLTHIHGKWSHVKPVRSPKVTGL